MVVVSVFRIVFTKNVTIKDIQVSSRASLRNLHLIFTEYDYKIFNNK